MTETTEANGQDPNANAGQNPNTEPTGNEQDSKPTGFDALPDETKAEIRKLRKENAGYRKKVDEFEEAGKSELEKAIGERDSLLKQLEAERQRSRGLTARNAVADAAGKANAISTNAVYALIRDSIEYDDESGEPTNVAALIAQAKKDEPSLFKAANGSGDGGRGGAATGDETDMNAMLRAAAGRG